MRNRSLGRKAPLTWEHVTRYPLSLAQLPEKPTWSVVGVNWYRLFFEPIQDSRGAWWAGCVRTPTGIRVANRQELGPLEGGHCFAFRARKSADPIDWWMFYDQDDQGFPARIGSPTRWKSGGCTGFGTARMMSGLNRKRYDPYSIYPLDQQYDELAETTPDGPQEGSSVNAALYVAKNFGLAPVVRGKRKDPAPGEGIAAYRWIRDLADWKRSTGFEGLPYSDGLNSWGTNYPHVVRWPDEIMNMLWGEDGEIAVVTDR